METIISLWKCQKAESRRFNSEYGLVTWKEWCLHEVERINRNKMRYAEIRYNKKMTKGVETIHCGVFVNQVAPVD